METAFLNTMSVVKITFWFAMLSTSANHQYPFHQTSYEIIVLGSIPESSTKPWQDFSSFLQFIQLLLQYDLPLPVHFPPPILEQVYKDSKQTALFHIYLAISC